MDVLPGSDPDVVGTRESLVRWGPSYALWSVSERRRLGEIRYPHEVERLRWAWGQGRLVLQVVEDNRTHIEALGFDGRRQRLGTVEFGSEWSWNNWVDRSELDRSSGNRLAAFALQPANNRVPLIEILAYRIGCEFKDPETALGGTYIILGFS